MTSPTDLCVDGDQIPNNPKTFNAKPNEAGTKYSNAESKMAITAMASEMVGIGP